MSQNNDPQIKRPSDANTPMISGRGTKIIVSARGAYEARNLPALFDAMDADQQTLFRIAVIVEMMDRIRHDIQQAAETRPEMLETLTLLAQWVFEPTQANADALYAPYLDDRISELDPLTYRLRGIVLATIYPRHNAIGYAKDALLYIPDDDVPQQPHYAIMESEIEDWIFEVGWAILHGRNTPPLNLDMAQIEELIGDVERWYSKKSLPILVQLMNADQRDKLNQAIRQQAMWHIDSMAKNDWFTNELELIEQVRQWVKVPTSFHHPASIELWGQYTKQRSSSHQTHWMIAELLRTFGDMVNPSELTVFYADNVLSLSVRVQQVCDPLNSNPHSIEARARQWQLDAAYAILTDHPIPPLE